MVKQFSLSDQYTDVELEGELLAKITQDVDTYWKVVDLIIPETFTQYREAYISIEKAIKNEEKIPALEGKKPSDNPIEAARVLVELHQKRLLADVAQDFSKNLKTSSPEKIILDLENKLLRVQHAVKEMRAGQITSITELWPEVLKEVAARRKMLQEEGKSAVGLPTGLVTLDKLLGGLQPGIHLLAAEPGQGKTTIGLQIATNVSLEGFPVIFVSLEESLQKLTLKTICSIAGLNLKKYTEGYGEPNDLEEAMQRHHSSINNIYFIEGTANLSIPNIKAKALQLMSRLEKPKCLIIIDYLQRWASSRQNYNDFRHVVSQLVSDLRELSFSIDSPLLVVSSQNRPGQGGARLTSLKESGDLEYSADSAIFLTKPQNRNASPPARAVDLNLEKNRYGDKGNIELIFRPDIGSFREETLT